MSNKPLPQLPRQFMPRPALAFSPDTVADFERLYKDMLAHGTGAEVAYDLAVPRWQFLCYLTDTKDIILHGSGDANILEFEPRRSYDSNEFGNREAVYAASDAIWAMFFAVVDRGPDRERQVSGTMNAALRVVGEDGKPGEPYYFFSINKEALSLKPWRNGTVYILPRHTFEQEPYLEWLGLTLLSEQWASLVPVRPLGKLSIEPSDFPFLDRILPHDQALVNERSKEDPTGFPWMD